MGKMIDLKAADGHALKAYLAEPAARRAERRRRAGNLRRQQPHPLGRRRLRGGRLSRDRAGDVRSRAARLRERNTQPEIQAGIALMQKISWDDAMKDASAAVEAVTHAGKVACRLLLGRRDHVARRRSHPGPGRGRGPTTAARSRH